MHPRTDPVIITAIIDETGDRILLGRNVRNPASERTRAHVPPPELQKKFPGSMWCHQKVVGGVEYVVYRFLLHSSWLYRAS